MMSRGAPPIADAADGWSGSTSAWRDCWMIAASGLHIASWASAATEVGVPEREDADGTPQRVTAEDAYAILMRLSGGCSRSSGSSPPHATSAAT